MERVNNAADANFAVDNNTDRREEIDADVVLCCFISSFSTMVFDDDDDDGDDDGNEDVLIFERIVFVFSFWSALLL